MGLNTTHDCWNGSYSSFYRWRLALAQALIIENKVILNDPLDELMQHSDCDGDIKHENCEAIANRLSELFPLLSDVEEKNRTSQFIAGLKIASKMKENVEFM